MASAEPLALPSGQSVTPHEALWETHGEEGGERWLVLRFLAPDIARESGTLNFADVAPDLDVLCEAVALPVVDATGGNVAQVIVNLMDRPSVRGESDPAVTQYMSAYRVETGTCIWE